MKKKLHKQLNLCETILPLVLVVSLCLLFFCFPEDSKAVVGRIRNFLGDEMGVYYILLGCGAVVVSMYMAFSRFGQIRLGKQEKPTYSNFTWGTMIFTSTMAADILFYSL